MRRQEEHTTQVAVVRWCDHVGRYHPGVGCCLAIPNGGQRDVRVAVRLRAEGVRPGVPDLFWPVARGQYHGLWIELKSSTGRVSAAQKAWIDQLQANGYRVEVCRTFEEAIRVVSEYFSIDTRWHN